MREFRMERDGPENPDGLAPCGAKDFYALLPEPIHWGGCKSCAEIIKGMLMARLKQRKRQMPAIQMQFLQRQEG